MDKFLEIVATSVSQMPPSVAAFVILALAVLAMLYAWRKAGEEAKREWGIARAGATETDRKLDEILEALHEFRDALQGLQTGIEVLKDRGKR